MNRIRGKRAKDKQIKCLTDLPGADCLNNEMISEAQSQEWLKKGVRTPGK